jgi:hypothetical protein
MRVIKKIIVYTDVSQKDIEKFHEEKDRVNDEGMVISEFKCNYNHWEPNKVEVTYVNPCEYCFNP